jgi:hypothetical protein
MDKNTIALRHYEATKRACKSYYIRNAEKIRQKRRERYAQKIEQQISPAEAKPEART